ncbi:hypothetical protein PENSTE_c005G09743 [Penicillium steckii]|uniref:Fungal calcium binding protein domain-containing protein n=1 Tax=Penicillium steckii TaxID=303698 RepID=A0A1V6TJL3_9EURO|nr:hypothetical protein PENSTE_c005G09743 [Penicillium steckii]
MKFHHRFLAIASLIGSVNPIYADVIDQENAAQTLREQNKLTVDQMPPACNLAACLGLSGTASCIVSALGSGDPAALQRCLVNGLSQICSCAACVPLVDNFLITLGVCVSRPGTNSTEAAVALLNSFMSKASSVDSDSEA